MKKFMLTVSSPDGDIFKDEVIKLILRGAEGDLAVLAEHAPFITSVKSGKCKIYLSETEIREATTDGGILSVAGNNVTLLSGSFKFI